MNQSPPFREISIQRYTSGQVQVVNALFQRMQPIMVKINNEVLEFYNDPSQESQFDLIITAIFDGFCIKLQVQSDLIEKIFPDFFSVIPFHSINHKILSAVLEDLIQQLIIGDISITSKIAIKVATTTPKSIDQESIWTKHIIKHTDSSYTIAVQMNKKLTDFIINQNNIRKNHISVGIKKFQVINALEINQYRDLSSGDIVLAEQNYQEYELIYINKNHYCITRGDTIIHDYNNHIITNHQVYLCYKILNGNHVELFATGFSFIGFGEIIALNNGYGAVIKNIYHGISEI